MSLPPPKTLIPIANWPITALPGLSDSDAEHLQALGIETTLQLLERSRSPQHYQQLLADLQVHPRYLNKWLALADLARLPEIGCDYNGLLLHTGICSLSQLAQASAHRLHPQLLRLHVTTLQRRDLCPSAAQVTQWIGKAKRLTLSPLPPNPKP